MDVPAYMYPSVHLKGFGLSHCGYGPPSCLGGVCSMSPHALYGIYLPCYVTPRDHTNVRSMVS